MDLTSCEHCGVVIDRSQLLFPDDYDDDITTGMNNYIWDNEEERYISILPCPVCKLSIKGRD